jgi:osmoprotectant transport system permease protein
MKWILAALLLLAAALAPAQSKTVRVGSKAFTESYVLGEIAKRLLTNAGLEVEHRQGMGATAIVWEALRSGAIDAYPEYTGTISEQILKSDGPLDLAGIRARLEPMGIGVTEELGFNNTYALVMRRSDAERLGIKKISDLARHPELRAGITHEFLDRKDGWKPLMARYGVSIGSVRGIKHELGYGALVRGDVDIKDAYSTDSAIYDNNLLVLEDDRNFFPQYKAVFLYRLNMPEAGIAALRTLEGQIDEDLMTRLNAEADRTKDYTAAANLFQPAATPVAGPTMAQNITRWTVQHLTLVGASLSLAVLVGLPLGIRASRRGAVSSFILNSTGIIQTIPSLALLALLVPLTGIDPFTAIIALFLYSLLPIVRNTAAGLQDIPNSLNEAAEALGLSPTTQLLKIRLPLASRAILTGIKTSAIINVGTATLAALIGAGGLGEPIISGLSLSDNRTILQGAIPAAILALLVGGAFDLLDRVLIPRGLRLPRT